MSWKPSIETRPNSWLIHTSWSPCSRFIVTSEAYGREIQIIDAVTLKKLKCFIHPHWSPQFTIFSPTSHLLTSVDNKSETIINWDLQTGVQVSEIPMEKRGSTLKAHSITYSECGMMFGVLFWDKDEAIAIRTYDVLSGAHIYCHLTKQPVMKAIWTCGRCLQFATLGLGSLTVWEIGFTSKHPPVEIKSLPTPNNFDPLKEFLFLSTCSQLAFTLEKTVLVWDAQHSRLLLNSILIDLPCNMTFSPNGCFFACGSYGPGIYLWKKSPTGYILHQKLKAGHFCKPLLSPNGQLVVDYSGQHLELWRTTDPTTSPSTTPTQPSRSTEPFILGLSPDRSFVVAARSRDNIVIVINLKSGITQLTIDTCMEIYGLMVIKNTIAVVGGGEVAIWNLPTGDGTLDARAGIEDSVWRREFGYSLRGYRGAPKLASALISPDLNYVATLEFGGSPGWYPITLYSVSMGKRLRQVDTTWGRLWFPPDRHELWCGDNGWTIVKDGESGITLKAINAATRGPSGGFPWQSSCGYKVKDDRWILNPSGKQLLWLPPYLRPSKMDRIWGGQFLACCELPEVVVLELPEE